MLKGISPLISPELLYAIHRMGHGDEIVFSDAYFAAERLGSNVIRANGIKIADLLDAVLPLFELDQYVDYPLLMMQVVEGDEVDPEVEKDYLEVVEKTHPHIKKVDYLERFKFYDRAEKSFAIVITSDTRKYGNIILKKGVTPVK